MVNKSDKTNISIDFNVTTKNKYSLHFFDKSFDTFVCNQDFSKYSRNTFFCSWRTIKELLALQKSLNAIMTVQ